MRIHTTTNYITTTSLTYQEQVDAARLAAAERVAARRDKKQVDEPDRLEVSSRRRTFHTVWRADYPKGYPMKIAVTDDKIVLTRNVEPKPNEFLVVDGKSKKRPIDLFADGKTRAVELDEGDSLVGTIDRLRAAAKTLTPPLSVRVRLDGEGSQVELRKTARKFRFELIPLVERKTAVAPAS